MAELTDVGTPEVDTVDMTDDDLLPGRRDATPGLARYTFGKVKAYFHTSPMFTGGVGINVAAVNNAFAARASGASFTFKAESYRTSVNNHVVFQADCAQGTPEAPTGLVDTTQMFQFLIRSWNGSAFSVAGNLLFQAVGDHGAGNLGTRFSFGCVPPGGTSNAELFSGDHATGVRFTPANLVTTFVGEARVTDQAYSSGWNGDLSVPTKNAIYDKFSKFSVGGGFTTALAASEVFLLYTFAEAVTFPDDFAGSVGDSNNPAATYVIDLYKNGAAVGTASISTTGVFTFSTSGGATSFAIGDRLLASGPASVGTATNVSLTLLGVKD